MSIATLRKLGGSTVVAIPPAMLSLLGCAAGDSVNFSFVEGKIGIEAVKPMKLSLKERLAMYEKALPLKTEAEKADDDLWMSVPAVGKEIL